MTTKKTPAKKPRGRPSKFTPALATEICNRLADGASLNSICHDDHMPERATIYNWLREYADFFDSYARAREDQADTYADQILDIAENEPDTNRARVRVDALKWIASKLKPKSYAEYTRKDLNVKGALSVEVIDSMQVTTETQGKPDSDGN